jgi:hypothetical protein
MYSASAKFKTYMFSGILETADVNLAWVSWKIGFIDAESQRLLSV